jgi:hypothetical protein
MPSVWLIAFTAFLAEAASATTRSIFQKGFYREVAHIGKRGDTTPAGDWAAVGNPPALL